MDGLSIIFQSVLYFHITYCLKYSIFRGIFCWLKGEGLLFVAFSFGFSLKLEYDRLVGNVTSIKKLIQKFGVHFFVGSSSKYLSLVVVI